MAAVADAILDADEGLADRLAAVGSVDIESIKAMVSAAATLHDIGKFSPFFQALVPACFPGEIFPSSPKHYQAVFNHGGAFSILVRSGLIGPIDFLNRQGRSGEIFESVVAGHHGRPTPLGPIESKRDASRLFRQQGLDAIEEYLQEVGLPDLTLPDEQAMALLSWPLAGLLTLSDWLASAKMPYASSEAFASLSDYESHARSLATSIVRDAGLKKPLRRDRARAEDFIGIGRMPRPMQLAVQHADTTVPGLIIMEDDTGSGKTEAALHLAQGFVSSGVADGLYVGLPTSATATGIYERAISWAHLFYEDNCNVVLAHGARDMNQTFMSSIRKQQTSGSQSDEEPSSEADGVQFLHDSLRLALLADFGVGTVDQALMGVLPIKFQPLRALGLFRKVLMLDEVHAYDAFMMREIEALVEFQAMYGMPVIVLSATLPASVKVRLVEAYARGAGVRFPSIPDKTSYPALTTFVPGRDVSVLAPEVPLERHREVSVSLIYGDAAIETEIRNALGAGQCVAWFRNTVADVQRSALELTDLAPIVFHARFTKPDRESIEGRIKSLFGPESSQEERAGKFVIASQVMEQSLNIDFDFVVTDLAPIDAIIQRAGRLHRHPRPWRHSNPRIVVNTPRPEAFDAAWYPSLSVGGAMVYSNHAIVWKSMQLLSQTPHIRNPASLREMVEAVYGDIDIEIPEGLLGNEMRSEGKSTSHRGIAAGNVIKPRNGYILDGVGWPEDVDTSARLSDEHTIKVRIGKVVGRRVVPWTMRGQVDDWRSSELALPKHFFGSPLHSKADEELVNDCTSRWASRARTVPLILCSDHDSGGLSLALPGILYGPYGPIRL